MSTTIFDTLNFPPAGFDDGVCSYTAGQPTTISCWAPGPWQSGYLNEPLWPWLACSFTTPATSPVVLTRVGVKLALWDSTFNGTTAVALVANNPNQPEGAGFASSVGTGYIVGPAGIAPGVKLVDLGSMSDTALVLRTTPNPEDFYFYSNYVLAPSTRYWISAYDISESGTKSGATWSYVAFDTVASNPAVANEFFWNASGSPVNSGLTPPEYWGVYSNNIQGPYQMQIDIN